MNNMKAENIAQSKGYINDTMMMLIILCQELAG